MKEIYNRAQEQPKRKVRKKETLNMYIIQKARKQADFGIPIEEAMRSRRRMREMSNLNLKIEWGLLGF